MTTTTIGLEIDPPSDHKLWQMAQAATADEARVILHALLAQRLPQREDGQFVDQDAGWVILADVRRTEDDGAWTGVFVVTMMADWSGGADG